MSKPLPDRLGCPKSGQAMEDLSNPKSRKQQVSTMLEWIQCFGIYIAVLTRKYPEQIPDLLEYQSLIIEVHLEYEGDNWLAYDRQFHLSAEHQLQESCQNTSASTCEAPTPDDHGTAIQSETQPASPASVCTIEADNCDPELPYIVA